MNSLIDSTVAQLKQGHTIAYPTEAVWGLGCDPHNEQAFQNILKLKNRPMEKGVILLASTIDQIQPMLETLSLDTQKCIIETWTNTSQNSRATTWLLPAIDVPKWITGKHASVAVRVTQHPLCKAICENFGSFIVSTSANPAGLEPARNYEEAQQYFGNKVYYVKGDLGICQEPSKIIDALTGQTIRA